MSSVRIKREDRYTQIMKVENRHKRDYWNYIKRNKCLECGIGCTDEKNIEETYYNGHLVFICRKFKTKNIRE